MGVGRFFGAAVRHFLSKQVLIYALIAFVGCKKCIFLLREVQKVHISFSKAYSVRRVKAQIAGYPQAVVRSIGRKDALC